jgi:hypothetical protein
MKEPPELTAFARRLLDKYPDRMQVITHFCDETQMDAFQAEALVNRVMAARQAELLQPRAGSATRKNTSTFIMIIVFLGLTVLGALAGLFFLVVSR